ncbi:hypothetical protein V5N11_004896 [Cardamine amara subsp. amara]|uniref:Retrotransposon gag domain-containing protein n=1 Tax=Cardamine amara subsp. amara TaxID=228776 RepID=A0ABD1ASK2_CARAN
MKAIMRKRFVLSYYYRELHNQLTRLVQGGKTWEDYYQELEALMIKADVREDREATMSRFLGGLQRGRETRWKCNLIWNYKKCCMKPYL